MADTWFWSDTHFSHARIMHYCNRPFSTIEEMDEAMIERHNALVKPNDTSWHLGDFGFGNRVQMETILKRLNGRKRFIRGNHDGAPAWFREHFESFGDYKELKIRGMQVVLMHYPIERWNARHHGTWHLHGHMHCTMPFEDIKRMDVGVDGHKFTPWSMDEIGEWMDQRGGYEMARKCQLWNP